MIKKLFSYLFVILFFLATVFFYIYLIDSSVYAATIGSDAFTGADGDDLQAHTPNTGTSWDTDAAAVPDIQGNRIASSNNNLRSGRLTDTVGDDDMDVTLIANLSGGADASNNSMGPAGRCAATERCHSAQNAYQCYIEYVDASGADLFLRKFVAGVETAIASYNANLSTSTDHTLKLEIRTAAKKCYVAGVERISNADDVLTGNNYCGLIGEDAEPRGDDWLCESVGAAAKFWPMVIGLIPTAHADEKPPAQYESDVCGDGKPEGTPRHPCVVDKYGFKNWSLQKEEGGKMYVNVFDEVKPSDDLRAEKKDDSEWPEKVQAEITEKGYSWVSV